MQKIISSITISLVTLSKNSTNLIPLLQTVAIILAFMVIGLIVWKGHP
ncbi:hypothetical protein AAKU55_005768 [Oxalobacteraceae bacterium GrIS 1.11]